MPGITVTNVDLPTTATDVYPGGEPGGDAFASIANADIALLVGTIQIGAATASASARCTGSSLAFSAATQVDDITIAGTPVTILGTPNQTVSQGGLTITLNEQAVTGGMARGRAVHITGPGVDIIVAEALTDAALNPCQQN